MSRNRCIGHKGTLPWHIPEDLKHFRRVTTGHVIIMGRKTHASIGKALPQRRNIVISHNAQQLQPGCEHAADLETALTMAYQQDDCPRIIGGAQVYAQALPRVSDVWITHIDRHVDGDTFFPDMDLSTFALIEKRPAENHEDVCFCHYRLLDS